MKSKPLTLIELLVVISLIALFSSLFGVNAYTMLKEYRFHQSCQSVATEILATTRVARAQGGAVELHFDVDRKGLLFRRSTDEAIPVDAAFFSFSKRYPSIESIEVDGQPVTSLSIRITPHGIIQESVTLKYREKFHKISLRLL